MITLTMANKVILISSIYPPQIGGPAIFTSRFAAWLTDKGIGNEVITYSHMYSLPRPNISEIPLGPIRIISFFRFVFTIARKVKKDTLILANGAFIETFLACKLTKRRYVAKIPGDPVWEYARNSGRTNLSREDFQAADLPFFLKSLRAIFNKSFKEAKIVITPSIELLNFLHTWGVSESRTKLVFNSVDPAKFVSMVNLEKKFDLVSVTRLVQGKGLGELIECSYKSKRSLLIVGDGPLMEDLKETARSLSADVTFAGSKPNNEIPQILASSKVFVLNSESEATSYALIEAKLSGLPILARRNQGSITIVRDGVDGIIYSSDSGLSLECAMTKIFANPDLIQQFGKMGRQDALERFNQEIIFNEILDLIKN
jgi:glycosyltransferase involved in cell wall biosynthesis